MKSSSIENKMTFYCNSEAGCWSDIFRLVGKLFQFFISYEDCEEVR